MPLSVARKQDRLQCLELTGASTFPLGTPDRG